MAQWSDVGTIATNLEVSGTDYDFASAAILLAPNETVNILIGATFVSTPLDDLLVKLQSTIDDGPAENWVDIGSVVTINRVSGETVYHLMKPDTNLYKLRLVFAASGAINTITVNASCRLNGYRGYQ